MKLYWQKCFVALSLTTTFYGCGTVQLGQKKGGSSAEREPAELDTKIVDKQVLNDQAQVAYEATQSDVAFKCRIVDVATSQQTAWNDCPASGYSFTLSPGAKVEFFVKAVTNGGVEDPSPARVSLHSPGAPSVESRLAGARTSILSKDVVTESGGTVQNSSYTFRFGVEGTELDPGEFIYECKSQSEDIFRTCEGSKYEFAALQHGKSYSLEVRARHQASQITLNSDTITFNVDLADGLRIFEDLTYVDIVGTYALEIPQGMHITQYSTSKNYTGGLIDAYQLAQGEDPNYLGLYPNRYGSDCSDYSSSRVGIVAPSSKLYKYCRSQLTMDSFVETYGNRFARNHVEVASDEETIRSHGIHERLLVQTFDEHWEFDWTRSRFEELCKDRIEVFPTVYLDKDLFNGYWFNETARGNMWVCTVPLSGLGGTAGMWKVGGFIYIDGVNQLELGCNSCYGGKRAIEVVYMAKADGNNSFDWQFAQRFQRLMMLSLGKTNPF